MSGFEIIFPINNEQSLDVTSSDFYNYDFGSHSLIPLQIAAGNTLKEKIKKELFSNVSQFNLIKQLLKEEKVEYVAVYQKKLRKKLNLGNGHLVFEKKQTKNSR